MYGSGIGTLTIKWSSDASEWSTFVTKSSNQGTRFGFNWWRQLGVLVLLGWKSACWVGLLARRSCGVDADVHACVHVRTEESWRGRGNFPIDPSNHLHPSPQATRGSSSTPRTTTGTPAMALGVLFEHPAPPLHHSQRRPHAATPRPPPPHRPMLMLNPPPPSRYIQFYYTAGGTYYGDIAIDEINIYEGEEPS